MRRVDHLVPDRLRHDSQEGTRARVLARAWAVSILFGSAMALQYAFTDVWLQVVLNASVAVLGLVMLVVLRGDLLPLSLVIHLSLALPAVAFAGGSLAQTPFDVTSVFFLVVIPLLASFALSARAALGWTLACFVLGSGATWLGFHGYTMPQHDPSMGTTQAVNFGFVLALVAVVSIGVHQLRTRAFHELDLASRAKTAFLANMSHELRTPMNGVLGLTQVMLGEPLTPDQRERLELIQKSGQVLVGLLNEVLDLARVEAGQLQLELVDVDPVELVADVHALFAVNARQKGLELTMGLGPGLPPGVRADARRLRQVLANLLGNAVKFTDAGQVRLTLESVPGDGALRFSVEDTGVGIVPEKLPRLFAAFEPGDARPTRQVGGTGLGLALSHRLVALMGGVLQVRSQVGAGSSFWFTLSLERLTRASPLPSPVPSAPRASVGTARVLVVDDNPVNLMVAAALVQKAGYACSTAVNGLQALERVQREPFDLVLMDCQMPELDGLEATRRIRALPGGAGRVPIVALTASAGPEDLQHCLTAGMNELLTKPLSRDALVATLTRLIPG